MNALAHLYPGDDAVVLAANVFVQIAGVSVVALVAAWTLARRNAALRHGILLAALAWICAAPLVAWTAQHSGLTLVRLPLAMRQDESPHAAPQDAASKPSPFGRGLVVDSPGRSEGEQLVVQDPHPAAASLRPGPVTQPLVGNNPHPGPLPQGEGDVGRPHAADVSQLADQSAEAIAPVVGAAGASPYKSLAGAAVLLWITGTAVLLARLAWGLILIARIRRELRPAGDDVAAVLARVRQSLGVESLPPIMLSSRLRGPATFGVRRPVVALPVALASQMTPDELHDALVHECAHALRRDEAVAIAQRVVAAVYWPHPLVHVLNRALGRAREEVCDNVVLRGQSPAEYARTLLSLSEKVQVACGGASLVGLLDRRWPLEKRVADLLNTRRIVMTKISRKAIAGVTAAVVVVGTSLAAIGAAREQTADKAGDVAKQAAVTDAEQKASGGKVQADAPPLIADKLLTLEEDKLQQKLEQARRDERRAELDVQETKVNLQGKEVELQQATESKAPASEINRARLNVDLAKIQMERAMLALEDVKAKSELIQPPPLVRVGVRGWPAGLTYSIRKKQVTLKQVLQSAFKVISDTYRNENQDEWLVTVDHGGKTILDNAPLPEVLKGKEADESAQPGDRVDFVRDEAVIRLEGLQSDPKRWAVRLRGRKLKLSQILAEAGVDVDSLKAFEKAGGQVEIGYEGVVSRLGQVLTGVAPDPIVTPGGDVLISKSAKTAQQQSAAW